MKKLFILFFFITLSCSNNKVVNNHGFGALELKADKINISKTNKNDVINVIGKPSTISLFDENIWFYIQRENINQSVFKLGKSKINKNTILEISFDKYGIVKEKKIYNLNDMKNLKTVKDTTEKTFQNTSYFGKVLKSMKQKIESPKTNKKR